MQTIENKSNVFPFDAVLFVPSIRSLGSQSAACWSYSTYCKVGSLVMSKMLNSANLVICMPIFAC